MKKTHIIGLILIAVSIGIIMSMVADSSSYENFESAARYPDREIHVIGTLNSPDSINYNPEKDPNFFSFYLEDAEGKIEKVVYHGAKPRDFEKSEQVVLTGRMNGEHFEATKILMKCPSKYVEDEIAVTEIKSSPDASSL